MLFEDWWVFTNKKSRYFLVAGTKDRPPAWWYVQHSHNITRTQDRFGFITSNLWRCECGKQVPDKLKFLVRLMLL
jgi:hypothetical protein